MPLQPKLKRSLLLLESAFDSDYALLAKNWFAERVSCNIPMIDHHTTELSAADAS
jgi:hypothetical protein